ncbi:hypothetical protein NPIL_360451 [Nephila pilipes]|uniref:Uncharacterized protein n=1 Tax=Nephila pilipes TaxID=299642 RepID=A0A8X6UPY3_NEPPI|nr:hypothetical protein NPIL_360451 [Nephila pilipes]
MFRSGRIRVQGPKSMLCQKDQCYIIQLIARSFMDIRGRGVFGRLSNVQRCKDHVRIRASDDRLNERLQWDPKLRIRAIRASVIVPPTLFNRLLSQMFSKRRIGCAVIVKVRQVCELFSSLLLCSELIR